LIIDFLEARVWMVFRKLISKTFIDAGFQHVEAAAGNGPPPRVTDITASCEFDHRSREEFLVLK